MGCTGFPPAMSLAVFFLDKAALSVAVIAAGVIHGGDGGGHEGALVE